MAVIRGVLPAMLLLAAASACMVRQAALGIGILHEGRIVGLGMTGERAIGTGDWATVEDAFDVASCTKSITATIAAMLVVHPGYASTTLELLLRHLGGLRRLLRASA